MLRVAICEDDGDTRGHLGALARRWARNVQVEVAVDAYASAEQLLFAAPDAGPADILLLDIDMPGENGMELARRLRAEAASAPGGPVAGPQIVFVTGIVDYALAGYEVDAVSYLLKPVREAQLCDALDRALARMRRTEEVLVVEGAGETSRVALSQVSYLEARGHGTDVVLSDGRCVASKLTLATLERELAAHPGRFVRVHRSYLVAVAHARRITRRDVEMDPGDAVPIARGRWDELNRAWLAWCRGPVS